MLFQFGYVIYLFFPLVIVFGVLWGIKAAFKSQAPKWMLGVAVVGAIAAGGLDLWSISNKTSSTASIGILFIPRSMAIGAGIFALIYVCGYYLMHAHQILSRSIHKIALRILALIIIVASGYFAAVTLRRVYVFEVLHGSVSSLVYIEKAYRSALRKKDYFVLSAVGSNSYTPREILLEMAKSDDPGMHMKRHGFIQLFDRDELAVLRKVIRNQNMPAEAIQYLAESPNEYVLSDVAWHRDTPVPLLRKILDKNDTYLIWGSLAGNPNTPVDILERLAQKKNRHTNITLSRNPHTPLPILKVLAKSHDYFVRGTVARNPAIDTELMLQLAKDENDKVRLELSFNKSLVSEVVSVLKNDQSVRIRQEADSYFKDKEYREKEEKTQKARLEQLNAISGVGY